MIKILTIFLISLNALSYGPKDLDVTTFEYNRYVKPQLKSIIQDYTTLIIILNPQLKVLKKSFSLKKKLSKLEYSLKDKCYLTKENHCFNKIREISTLLNKLKQNSYNKVDFDKVKNLTIDEKIKAQNLLVSFFQEITKAQLVIENLILEGKLLSPKLIVSKPIKKLITNITTFFDLFILQASDNRFQDEFTTYWSSFVKPVERNILIRNDKQFFLSNINDLNIRWNALNIRLTKRNFSLPKQAKTLLKIMHNRWNNILKVSLITNGRK
jgi:hypothetical protein